MNSMRPIMRTSLLLLLAASVALLACDDRRGGDVEVFSDVTGTVVSLEPERRQLTVAHDDIPGLMAAMTMPFDVEDPAVLETVAPGDRIRFTLRRIDGRLGVRAIERLPEAADPAARTSPAP
jgi:Cu(I)/Ag(I) efflux system periplasmic protein CusF